MLAIREYVPHQRDAGNVRQRGPAQMRRCAGEIALHQFVVKAHALEYLCAAVSVHRADAHFGHYAQQPILERGDKVLPRPGRIDPLP